MLSLRAGVSYKDMQPPIVSPVSHTGKDSMGRGRVALVRKIQPRYPLLLQLLSTTDSIAGRHSEIPNSEGIHHAIRSSTTVCQPLSDITAEQEGFQKELHLYWNQHREARLSLPLRHSSNSGIANVRNGIEIGL